ncbi:MAG: CPBP family intramembrane metalloprotease [Deltaproteobacteria bacterium]|nr:CPBP family intramembrane metalloprotease [Deltaproteobacteria bacterium]
MTPAFHARSFLVATLLLLATRNPGLRRRTPPGAWILGMVSGFAAYPLWIWVISRVGLFIGLEDVPADAAPQGILTLFAVLALGPLFEELLYRERLLDTLATARLPCCIRLIATSVLFALPHLQPWPILGTFFVGLALALVYESTHCVGFCIALHAGLNLASVISPLPASGSLLGLLAASAFAWGLRIVRRTQMGMDDAVAAA